MEEKPPLPPWRRRRRWRRKRAGRAVPCRRAAAVLTVPCSGRSGSPCAGTARHDWSRAARVPCRSVPCRRRSVPCRAVPARLASYTEIPSHLVRSSPRAHPHSSTKFPFQSSTGRCRRTPNPTPRRSPPMATHQRPLHALLGGGAVADVLLWRRRNVSAAAVAGATLVWFLFERAGYSLPSVLSNAVLLLVVILFFWAKSASMLNRPLPPLPNLEVSDVVVEKAADRALVWINKLLAVGHDIAIKRDRTVFIQVILVLWVVSCIGMLFNFFTLIYIGVILCLLVPPFYERYQDLVDEKVGLAHKVLSKHFDTIISKTGQPSKQKKAE